jgi:hypothetical protein
MKTYLACLVVAYATLVVPDLAHACGNGTVQFADDFKTPDAGWARGDDNIKMGSGALTLLPPLGQRQKTYNDSYIFSDADFCVQIKLSDLTKPDTTGGLMFWITDFNNHYAFMIHPDGTWSFERRTGSSRWIVLNHGSDDAIKKGAGVVNEVEVRLSGNAGTGYVNGTKVATFNGQAPDGGGFFGLIAQSEDKRVNIWEFRDFRILKLP